MYATQTHPPTHPHPRPPAHLLTVTRVPLLLQGYPACVPHAGYFVRFLRVRCALCVRASASLQDALQELDGKIRMLRLEVQELVRDLALTRKLLPSMPHLAESILDQQKALALEKKVGGSPSRATRAPVRLFAVVPAACGSPP